ncbi:hypothetical protein ES703_113945 [subsurface metagenome]
MEDKYVNKAYAKVIQTVINTLTFSEIHTGLAMFEKVAWIIHRILWFPGGTTYAEMVAPTDSMGMAVVGNDKMSVLDLSDQAVYDLAYINVAEWGTPANASLVHRPFVRDFTGLPGKGLIVPPRPIYMAFITEGFAAVAQAAVRIEFTYKKLKAEEYWELVEATRIIE